jgi:hypothetical protein
MTLHIIDRNVHATSQSATDYETESLQFCNRRAFRTNGDVRERAVFTGHVPAATSRALRHSGLLGGRLLPTGH